MDQLNVQDFILVLQTFFDPDSRLHSAFIVLSSLFVLFPLLELHQNQRLLGRRPPQATAWLKAAQKLLRKIYERDLGTNGYQEDVDYTSEHIENLSQFLGLRRSVENPLR